MAKVPPQFRKPGKPEPAEVKKLGAKGAAKDEARESPRERMKEAFKKGAKR